MKFKNLMRKAGKKESQGEAADGHSSAAASAVKDKDSSSESYEEVGSY